MFGSDENYDYGAGIRFLKKEIKVLFKLLMDDMQQVEIQQSKQGMANLIC